jgi:small subunit ribosomal protein S20
VSAIVISSHKHRKGALIAQGTTIKIKKRKKSVLKRAAQSIKRAAVNRSNRTRVRGMMRSLRSAVGSGDAGAAGKLLQPTISAIDRAVTKGVLEKNTANRYKSRLSIAYNSMNSSRPGTSAKA